MKQYTNPPKPQWEHILARPTQDFSALEPTVREVFNEVNKKGDAAILAFTKQYDQVVLDSVIASEVEINEGANMLEETLKEAIIRAKTNIEKFHRAQISPVLKVETLEGVECWRQKKPIQKVGLYIPGGTAPLFSTVLMLAIPAQIAGCEEIVLTTPPQKDGTLHPAICFAAKLCGVTKVVKAGGIQAIAALTLGTESIPKVFKIFGPGNQYVTVAKQYATQLGVAIDMPAGPSEVLVLADDTANPAFVAADLLSQAEHGIDSQVVLVTTSSELISKVEEAIKMQLETLPRKDTAAKALENSTLIYFDNLIEAIDLVNHYAPEHLIVAVKDEQIVIDGVLNAGSVFLGNYTPESVGDYASGTNHTLPTNGFAKQYSGVNLDAYLKSITYQKLSKQGLEGLRNTVITMAEAEGLKAHANAVRIRFK